MTDLAKPLSRWAFGGSVIALRTRHNKMLGEHAATSLARPETPGTYRGDIVLMDAG